MPPPARGEGKTPAPRVLVVDDVRNIRRTLELVLAGDGFEVVCAETAEEGLEICARQPVDVALVDLMLPGMSGLEMLERLRADELTQRLPVIVISGHATVQDAVYAIRLGAVDFFEKPLMRERVLLGVRNALSQSRLLRTVERYGAEAALRHEMIGKSEAMRALYHAIERVAPTRASVLITGESGTGKELVSRAIHEHSARAEGPFVKVNCAAIPRELIESELFGHERGSFTGAEGRKRGLFEQAHGGTILLDEIGDMDPSAQSKLLRALQSGEINRVGSEQSMQVDVRVLAATNKDLAREVLVGRFREDLYFRLAVFPIRTPSLAEHPEDVPELAESFLEAFCRDNGMRPKRFEQAALAAIAQRSYPGNVRELKNLVERAAILAQDVVTLADLPEAPRRRGAETERTGDEPQADLTLREVRKRAEHDHILRVLGRVDWNISRAATLLGIERTNLHKKMRSYGIRRGPSSSAPGSAADEATDD